MGSLSSANDEYRHYFKRAFSDSSTLSRLVCNPANVIMISWSPEELFRVRNVVIRRSAYLMTLGFYSEGIALVGIANPSQPSQSWLDPVYQSSYC